MPKSPVRARRRRLVALVAASTFGAAIVPTLVFASGPAAAGPACAPSGYTAAASADLVKLDLLTVSPLGLLPGPIANVTIGHATADMAHAAPNHATGAADYLSATLAGITVPPALLNTHAHEDAPPANTTPDSHSLVALDSGLLDLGVGNVKAFAGKAGTYTCGVATGDASIADAAVLRGLRGHSLVALPDNLNGRAGAGLISVGGHPAAGAGADIGVAELDAFAGTAAEIDAKVITEPTLKGIATGTAATSSVTYTSPVLDLTLPGGVHKTLDSAHASIDVVTSAATDAVSGLLSTLDLPVSNLPVPGKQRTQLELRLSIGDLTSHVSGTHVSGAAATLRVQVLLVPPATGSGIVPLAVSSATPVLDLGLGVLSVDATAPEATVPAPSGPPSTPASPICTGGGYGYGAAACPSTPASPCGCAPRSAGPSMPPATQPAATQPPSASPSASTTVKATSGGSLPLTGSKTGWVVGAGVGLLLAGRFVMLLARRKTVG